MNLLRHGKIATIYLKCKLPQGIDNGVIAMSNRAPSLSLRNGCNYFGGRHLGKGLDRCPRSYAAARSPGHLAASGVMFAASTAVFVRPGDCSSMQYILSSSSKQEFVGATDVSRGSLVSLDVSRPRRT